MVLGVFPKIYKSVLKKLKMIYRQIINIYVKAIYWQRTHCLILLRLVNSLSIELVWLYCDP